MNIKKENRSISSLIENCKYKGINITDRKDFLIGLDDYLDSDLIRTWEEVIVLYSSSISLPKNNNDFGRFLSLAGKLSQGWTGYLTDSDLFNRSTVREIVNDLFGFDIDIFTYFDWCLELSYGKYEKVVQEYWNRLDNNGRESLLNLYMEKLIRAIIDVFCISLNREDFDRIFNNLEPDVREDLLRFDLI
jgi:hypothetical protein